MDRGGRRRGPPQPAQAGRGRDAGGRRSRHRHLARGGCQGDRSLRPAWAERDTRGARRLHRRRVRSLRLRPFRRGLRHRSDGAPHLAQGARGRRGRGEDRGAGPAHLDAGARPAALGEVGLWRRGAGSVGEALEAHPHRHARLVGSLWAVHQRRGADGSLLRHFARLPHGRRGDRPVSGDELRGRALPAGRSGRHGRLHRRARSGEGVPRLRAHHGFSGRHSDQ